MVLSSGPLVTHWAVLFAAFVAVQVDSDFSRRGSGYRGAKPFESAQVTSRTVGVEGVEREGNAGCCRSRWADQGVFVHGKY